VDIIHHEDIGLRILREVSFGDVLPVAAVIRERQRVLVQNLDEALWPAAMLDIGLPIGGCRREIEAVGVRQKRREVFVDLGTPAAVLLGAGVSLARSLAGLDRLHRRGERHVAGIAVTV
jgi:hypothetical protein